MPVKMQPHQLEFWRELLAPFAPHELSEVPKRGGRGNLTYIDKRALENRLDSVCGPAGWYPEYEATARGYKCRLHILVPMSNEGTSTWLYKEDGAGFEEMGHTNKQTGEFEYDVDNDEKSGYTNALRRAAQDAWGIGRYLYGKGIPSFLDPDARPNRSSYPPKEALVPQAQRSEPTPPAQQTPTQQSWRDKAQAQPQDQPRQYDNFNIPKPGKSVFAWAKEMEKVFETKLIDGMGREGEKLGVGKMFAEWDAATVKTICDGVIAFVSDLPTYKGQFDHLRGEQHASQPQAQAPAPSNAELSPLRKELMQKMQALVERQIGRKAEPAELKEALANIGANCVNGKGRTGECPESLAKCTDAVWIANMITFVDNQIAQSVSQGDHGDDDIPF